MRWLQNPPEPILGPDFYFVSQLSDGRFDSLETSIHWTAVHIVDGRIDLGEGSRQLLGLLYTVCGEGDVRGNVRRRGYIGMVFAGGDVESEAASKLIVEAGISSIAQREEDGTGLLHVLSHRCS